MNWVSSTFSPLDVQPTKRRKLDGECFPRATSAEVWVNTWKPKKKEDLVVHKKKVEEVQSWLEWTKRGFGSSALLLTGPPGCGKLTTLKVLCSFLGINLVEWMPQVAKKSYDPENLEYNQGDVSLFEEFVLRATRYSNVFNSQSSRMIVVKDIPNGFTRDCSRFQDFLENYTTLDRVYLCFITTDVKITRELFSESIKQKYNIKTISFNPVTQRSVKTTLEKIAKSKFTEYIDGISLSCNGDLRNAITTLQFLSVKGELPQKGKKGTKENVKKTDVIDLFKGLGRVLYAKRDGNGKLAHCPVEVGDSFTSSPELFLGMLQQNYLNTFSSIHDAAKASHKLSVSNVILSDYKDTNTSRSLGLIIASHALMSHNSKPIKKFQQFDKPRKVISLLQDSTINNFNTCDSIIDLVTFGRHIPAFTADNKELISKYTSFK
ncbi:cell cycle checkpoint protein RAD17 [Cimex lectularius]|uniref:Cell cycle checkpoint protein RAD17 n=1 Tax=Cimex lectularius TaxID=79782 RepID=A0A8I6SDA5_CIMLE|nr:cell cycle checkpoint protein RAD17 [Cimex lectularius]